MIDLTGKRALVTGGGSGIGRAVCAQLGAAGARIAVADIDDRTARASVAELAASGIDATAIQVDMADERSIRAMFGAAQAAFGGLDIVVNSAGVQDRALIEDIDSAVWDRTLNINLRGTFLSMREAGKIMAAEGVAGKIVNISSIAAFRAFCEGLTAYNASKAGVNALTRNGAREFAPHGIRVNGVAPGPTETPGMQNATGPAIDDATAQALVPLLGRFARPDDIAKAVLFLASDLADWITGQTIVVDGGDLAR